MLYSHRQATPAPLPHRIRFADGSTRTDRTTFTPDELERAGYSGPYERPTCDPTVETIDWDSEALEYVVRPYNIDEIENQWKLIRSLRKSALERSDWTQISDYDLGADRKVWATYRQKLRDITTQHNPFNISWPIEPNILEK